MKSTDDVHNALFPVPLCLPLYIYWLVHWLFNDTVPITDLFMWNKVI